MGSIISLAITDDTTCASCGTKCGPYTTTEPSGQLDIYGHAIMQPVINWIPVYHRTLTYLDNQRPLLCRECVENEWWKYHENLHLVAEHMCGDVENIVYMLEKPWKYVDEWWTAFGVEQDAFFAEQKDPRWIG